MLKRNILIAIVCIASITNVYLNITYDNFTPIMQLLLMVIFYLIVLIFYRNSIMIAIFCGLTILSLFGYHMLLNGQLSPGANQLYGSMSLLLGLISFLVAFLMALQHKYYKFIEGTFMIVAIINLVFFSYVNFFVVNLLVQFYGPHEMDLIRMFEAYNWVVIGVIILMGLTQMLLIYLLDSNQKKRQRELIEYEKIFGKE